MGIFLGRAIAQICDVPNLDRESTVKSSQYSLFLTFFMVFFHFFLGSKHGCNIFGATLLFPNISFPPAGNQNDLRQCSFPVVLFYWSNPCLEIQPFWQPCVECFQNWWASRAKYNAAFFFFFFSVRAAIYLARLTAVHRTSWALELPIWVAALPCS